MKITDDYSAKLKIWAASPQITPTPRAVGLPRFGSRKFSSYEEMNAWKRELLSQLAAKGGCQWTK